MKSIEEFLDTQFEVFDNISLKTQLYNKVMEILVLKSWVFREMQYYVNTGVWQFSPDDLKEISHLYTHLRALRETFSSKIQCVKELDAHLVQAEQEYAVCRSILSMSAAEIHSNEILSREQVKTICQKALDLKEDLVRGV